MKGIASIFPSATESDLAEALEKSIKILERFHRAGMITATEAGVIKKAKGIINKRPASKHPEPIFFLKDGVFSVMEAPGLFDDIAYPTGTMPERIQP